MEASEFMPGWDLASLILWSSLYHAWQDPQEPHWALGTPRNIIIMHPWKKTKTYWYFGNP